MFERNRILYHLPTNTSTRTNGNNFLEGLAQKKPVTKEVHLQMIEREQKYTQVLCVTSAFIHGMGIHRVASFFTPLTLSSPPLWVCTEASVFLILEFHHQRSHGKIFHHHKSTWLLLMLGLKLHKHYEILEERVKWINSGHLS